MGLLMTSGRKVLYVERLRPPLWPLFTDWKTPVFSYPRLIRRGLRKFSGRTGFIFVYPGRVRSALSLELGRTQIDVVGIGLSLVDCVVCLAVSANRRICPLVGHLGLPTDSHLNDESVERTSPRAWPAGTSGTGFCGETALSDAL